MTTTSRRETPPNCASATSSGATGAGGKLDLVVDRSTSAWTPPGSLADVVLPAATWYEKDDLNTTDLHSFIHPLQAAVPPCWEAKSDWDAFAALARKVTALARRHLPEPVKDVVHGAVQHDTPAEMAAPELRRLAEGRVRAGARERRCPALAVVERDYAHLHDRFPALGPPARANGVGAHGLAWPIDDEYDGLAPRKAASTRRGEDATRRRDAGQAANLILRLAPETNGEMAWRAFHAEEKKVGLPLADLAEPTAACARRSTTSAASRGGSSPRPAGPAHHTAAARTPPYALNVERLVPWRTLTGRRTSTSITPASSRTARGSRPTSRR